MIGQGMIRAIMGAMGQAAIGIVVKLATRDFFQLQAERAAVYMLRQWAKQTTNTLDDQIVEDIAKRLGVE